MRYKLMRTGDNVSNISICALMPYPFDTTPSQRFRLEQWMPYLEADGIRVDILPFVDDELMRLLHQPGKNFAKAIGNLRRLVYRFSDIICARRYDIVFIHRAACIVGPALLERLVAKLGRPVVYDFDDAIFMLHTTAANRRFGWLKFPAKTATICRLSSHIVVGNQFLADYAQPYNSNVTIIPTSIDTDYYQPVQKTSNGKVIIGWTGSSTSQTHLEMFAPVLREFFAKRDAELRVISNREPELPGIDYTWRPWTPETEVEELSHFDVGIMPMPEDKWARGKCALKALQYMAVGVPTICSAVGTNCEVIHHGENGLLATTREDWIASLERLVDSPQLRIELGAAGRQTVERHYSARHCAQLFAEVVRATVRSPKTVLAGSPMGMGSLKK